MYQLRRDLRGLLRPLIEVARQDGPFTGAELGVLLSFVEGWVLIRFGEAMNHDQAAGMARRLARLPSRPDHLAASMQSLRQLAAQHPERAAFVRRHLEAMMALNTPPSGLPSATHRLMLRTLGDGADAALSLASQRH